MIKEIKKDKSQGFDPADWINSNLSQLSMLDDNKGVDVLMDCGKSCCEASVLFNGACEVRNKSNTEANHDTLFNEFKERYYNSDNFTKDGNTITLVFEECTCNLVKMGVNNSFLCNCTLGYSKKLFKTLFGKNVSIKLLNSILKGDSCCKQLIIIMD